MRLSQLVGQRLKEAPKDASLPSHIYLLRGGYMRPVAAGSYSLLPLGKKVVSKIENIIREEMNNIGGQETLLPVVLPRELWEESGRIHETGPELLQFANRNDKPMMLGMTHEEAIVDLTRTEVNSYKQLPFMLYQIQTKYRDEARPRGGLIRVREFTMKDAYSFHADEGDLNRYYDEVLEAYNRIFEKIGLRDTVVIESDPGMMGGAVSHEFMALTDYGEDTVFMSPDRSYKANREVASTGPLYEEGSPLPLEEVYTPEQKTIADVAAYLGLTTSQTCKVVFYETGSGNLVVAMIRGDIEVNETKLQKHLNEKELDFASEEKIRAAGAEPGFASPMSLTTDQLTIVVDPSAAYAANLVVGANAPDYHYKNFNYARDLNEGAITDIATAREGDPCPITGSPLQIARGIEVGNIFKLGTKYTESMECVYLDENGRTKPMTMGCYGIGMERTMAAVVEQWHDDYGPMWPLTIAPYQVHLCALNPKKGEVQETAEKIYQELLEHDIEVLYDDRGYKAGFMFSDADLIGVPLRIIVSPKSISTNQVEFKTRDGNRQEMVAISQITEMLNDLLTKSKGGGLGRT